VKAENPNLKKIISSMNNSLFEQMEFLRKQQEDDRWVELKNGDLRKVLMKDAVSDMHDKINNICTYVQPLKDFSTVHSILKKWKFYWWGLPAGGVTTIVTIWKIFNG